MCVLSCSGRCGWLLGHTGVKAFPCSLSPFLPAPSSPQCSVSLLSLLLLCSPSFTSTPDFTPLCIPFFSTPSLPFFLALQAFLSFLHLPLPHPSPFPLSPFPFLSVQSYPFLSPTFFPYLYFHPITFLPPSSPSSSIPFLSPSPPPPPLPPRGLPAPP